MNLDIKKTIRTLNSSHTTIFSKINQDSYAQRSKGIGGPKKRMMDNPGEKFSFLILKLLGLFAGWCWYWFGLTGAGFFERKTLLAS